MLCRPPTCSPKRALSIQISANGNIGLNPAPKRKPPQAGKGAPMKKNTNRPCLPDTAPRKPKQVAFPKPFPRSPNVAIIGGGLSGLVCSIELARRGIRSTVFDTGEHGVGGRLATRSAADSSLRNPEPLTLDKRLVFDHASQYFTAADPRFVTMVESWVAAGAVEEWAESGSVGTLDLSSSSTSSSGNYTPLHGGNKMYIGKGGMRKLAEFLATTAESFTNFVDIRRPLWVNTIKFLNSSSSGGGFGWKVLARGVDQGVYDAVVIAHNGKCANRLTAPMGTPEVHAALRKLKLSANWVLMVAFQGKTPVPVASIHSLVNKEEKKKKMEGAFVIGSEILSWIGNNTAKLKLDNVATSSSSSYSGILECWTLISTQKYGKLNKVPQEAIPLDVAAQITDEMLDEFARGLLGASASRKDLPPVVYSKAQLWGAALPMNSPNVGCIWDTAGRVGVAGDWVAGGGSMEAAALSGLAMAECIVGEASGSNDGRNKSVGLDAVFQRVNGQQIGVFPTTC